MCVLVLCAHAEAWLPETVPSPKVEGQDYYVSNPDGVLDGETVARLDEELAQLNRDTYVEIAVVAVDSMAMRYDGLAYWFALDLFNGWGIRDGEKNTGVLVFLARSNRDIQIITGDGIAGVLTDAKCGEILDDNIDYLSADDFDAGLRYITEDIIAFLMEDENRSELLLGWHPEDTEATTFWTWYFIVGCLLMILIALCGYKVLNSGQPGEPVEDVKRRANDMKGGVGCLCWIFPLPLLIYYFWHIRLRDRLKQKPLLCAQCGKEMSLLEGDEALQQLGEKERCEQKIEAFRFDVWRCPECGKVDVKQYKGGCQFRYSVCPDCGAYAKHRTHQKVTKRPTYETKGERIDYYTCECCGKKTEKQVILPKKVYESSSSSWSSDSSSSSSWGGSWSSSSSSSGSWGGGHSSGGGAGRRF